MGTCDVWRNCCRGSTSDIWHQTYKRLPVEGGARNTKKEEERKRTRERERERAQNTQERERETEKEGERDREQKGGPPSCQQIALAQVLGCNFC